MGKTVWIINFWENIILNHKTKIKIYNNIIFLNEQRNYLLKIFINGNLTDKSEKICKFLIKSNKIKVQKQNSMPDLESVTASFDLTVDLKS